MRETGLCDDRYDEISRTCPAPGAASMQIIGSPERATLDTQHPLPRRGPAGGRLAGARDGVAQLSGSLPNICALAI